MNKKVMKCLVLVMSMISSQTFAQNAQTISQGCVLPNQDSAIVIVDEVCHKVASNQVGPDKVVLCTQINNNAQIPVISFISANMSASAFMYKKVESFVPGNAVFKTISRDAKQEITFSIHSNVSKTRTSLLFSNFKTGSTTQYNCF